MARGAFAAAAAAAAVLALAVRSAAQTQQQCVPNGNEVLIALGSASYDVSSVVAAESTMGLQIIDSRDASIDGYRYYVSLCSDITSACRVCARARRCAYPIATRTTPFPSPLCSTSRQCV